MVGVQPPRASSPEEGSTDIRCCGASHVRGLPLSLSAPVESPGDSRLYLCTIGHDEMVAPFDNEKGVA